MGFKELIFCVLASTAWGTLVELPPPPTLTSAGHALILDFEGFDARPAWPQGSSGVTVGFGYDTGYYSKGVIYTDWHELIEDYKRRLSEQSGITGRAAHERIARLRDILIDRAIGTRVFDNVDVAREYANCRHAFRGFDALRPNAQAVLISLTFNRGTSMIGPNRSEMREIRDAIPNQNYVLMAYNLRKMTRVWKGTGIENGMTRRRYAEARLMETS